MEIERDRISNREILKAEFLSQPVLGTIVGELSRRVEENPVLQERLKWIGISGSKANRSELRGANGVISDDDLVILLDGADKDDPLNMEAYDAVLDGINIATERLVKEKGIVPVYASTIRLEDAQMAIARLASPQGTRLRMVHSLIYTSPEAVIAFEPPVLARNLFEQSLGLWGNDSSALEVGQMARDGIKVENANLTIGGLDGISDNYRMLRNNRHILPPVFLGPQVIHVLDYSLKWAMAAVVEKESGHECGTWEEIIHHFPLEQDGEALIDVVKVNTEFRSQGENVDLDQVEELYRRVIKLWPLLTDYRNRK